jgi:predicted Zn finger-like uncharacterized protein
VATDDDMREEDMITTTCPNCKVLFRLADDLAGAKVKCQKCAYIFVVAAGVQTEPEPLNVGELQEPKTNPDAGAVTAAPAPKATAAPAPQATDDDEDDDRERSSPPRSARRTRDDDEDDEDDDRDRRRSRRRKDDDDDDDSRRPSRRRKQKAGKSSSLTIALILVGLGSCVVLCAGCAGGLGIWYAVANRAADNPPAAQFPPGGINVFFKPDRTFRSDNVLQFNDPIHPQDPKPRKIYTVHMVQGQTYQIDMISRHFDSYVMVIDDLDRIVAEDDDGGGFPDARLFFRPPRTGFYRIHATSFNGGQGNFRLFIRRSNDGRFAPPPRD